MIGSKHSTKRLWQMRLAKNHYVFHYSNFEGLSCWL
jgi:hypothetical protein